MPGARYVNLGDQARTVLGARLAHFVEAAAIIVRDEIVAVIEEGDPSGRFYFVPDTRTLYQASAPGEPPAVREAVYVGAWQATPAVVGTHDIRAGVFNDRFVGRNEDIPLWLILEEGTTPQFDLFIPTTGARGEGMAPRPHIAEAVERAVPLIRSLAGSLAA